MNIINSNSVFSANFLNDHLLLPLKPQHKKILIIAFLALGSIAACYAIISYYFKTDNSNKKYVALAEKRHMLEKKLKLDNQNNRKPQLVSQVARKTHWTDLPLEMQSHIFNFLPLKQIVMLGQVSKELKENTNNHLNSFENLLRIFLYKGNRNDQNLKKKKIRCLIQLLDYPNLRNYLKNKDNCDAFFEFDPFFNISLDDCCADLTKDKVKILIDLYFEFAGDKNFCFLISDFINHFTATHTLNFLDSLEVVHLKQLTKLKLDVEDFINSFHYVKGPTAALFDIILDFYQAKPHLNTWGFTLLYSNQISLRIFVMSAMILIENKHDFFHDCVHERNLKEIKDLDWLPCFKILLPRLGKIEKEKLKTLMTAILRYDIATSYESVMLILETKNNCLISTFLKEFLALNHAHQQHEKGFACIIESIVTQEQAIALIQAIQSIPSTLQTPYFRKLHHRIQLINKANPEMNVDYFFGRIRPSDLFQDWDNAFRTCGLELNDYV